MCTRGLSQAGAARGASRIVVGVNRSRGGFVAAIPLSLQRLFGALSSFLRDPRLRRLVVRGADHVEVMYAGLGPESVTVPLDEPALLASLEAMAQKAGKPFDADHPAVEAMLRDGTRFLAFRPPVCAVPVLIVTRPGRHVVGAVAEPMVQRCLADGGNLLWVEAGRAEGWAAIGPAQAGAQGVFVGLVDEPAPTAVMRLSPHRGAVRPVSLAELLLAGERMGTQRLWVAEPKANSAWEVLLHLSGRRAPMAVHVSARSVHGALSRLEGLGRAAAGPQRSDGVPALLAAGLDVAVVVRDGRVVELAELRWLDGRAQWRDCAVEGAPGAAGLVPLPPLVVEAPEAEPASDVLVALPEVAPSLFGAAAEDEAEASTSPEHQSNILPSPPGPSEPLPSPVVGHLIHQAPSSGLCQESAGPQDARSDYLTNALDASVSGGSVPAVAPESAGVPPAQPEPDASIEAEETTGTDDSEAGSAAGTGEDSIDIEIDLSMVAEAQPGIPEALEAADDAPEGADDALRALLASLGADSGELDPEEEEEESTTMVSDVADEVGDDAAAALANRTFSQILRSIGAPDDDSWAGQTRERHTVVHSDED